LIPGKSLAVNYQRTPPENALELALHVEDEWSLSDKLARHRLACATRIF
jgi:hypothetical protein